MLVTTATTEEPEAALERAPIVLPVVLGPAAAGATRACDWSVLTSVVSPQTVATLLVELRAVNGSLELWVNGARAGGGFEPDGPVALVLDLGVSGATPPG